MARTKKSPRVEKPQFSIHTVSLMAGEATMLQRLSRDASDFLGRSISSSAVVRALVRQVGKQDALTINALFLEIEHELRSGVIWGKKK